MQVNITPPGEQIFLNTYMSAKGKVKLTKNSFLSFCSDNWIINQIICNVNIFSNIFSISIIFYTFLCRYQVKGNLELIITQFFFDSCNNIFNVLCIDISPVIDIVNYTITNLLLRMHLPMVK